MFFLQIIRRNFFGQKNIYHYKISRLEKKDVCQVVKMGLTVFKLHVCSG
jgi:hypothetical protein